MNARIGVGFFLLTSIVASAHAADTDRLLVLGRADAGQPVQLYRFDPQDIDASVTPVAITGVEPGDTLVSIANDPATGTLYAYSLGRRLYQVSKTTGVATEIGTANTSLPTMNGNSTWNWIRIDPVTGGLRFVHLQHGNYLLNKADNSIDTQQGDLEFAAGDVNFGSTAGVISLAFSNSHDAATSTTAYLMSGNSTYLTECVEIAGGSMTTVGSLGFLLWGIGGLTWDLDGTLYAASDIQLVGLGGPSSEFYSIDADTGAATFLGEIGTPPIDVFDIAIDYDPTSSDRDRDGYPNDIEDSVGVDTRNPTETPFDGVSVAPEKNLVTTLGDKVRVKLRFDQASRDSLLIQGSFQLDPGEEFEREGQRVIVDVGGSVMAFDLDAKGKAESTTGARIAVSKPSALGVVKFKVKHKNTNLQVALADEGLIDTTVTDSSVNVRTELWLANRCLSMTSTLDYDAVANVSGTAHE